MPLRLLNHKMRGSHFMGDGMTRHQQNRDREPVSGVLIPDERELLSDAEISAVYDGVTDAPIAVLTRSQFIRALYGESLRAHMPIVALGAMAQDRSINTCSSAPRNAVCVHPHSRVMACEREQISHKVLSV